MYLLDTCAFIWSIQNSFKLSKKVIEILDSEDKIYISKVTLWEIAIKKTIGKLNLKQNTFELEELCQKENIEILPIKLKYFERIQKLPLIHRDPFDRIIMASAIEEDYILLTCDSNITQYNEIKCLW